jgi:TetR/AcrR family transcriptional regulator
VTVPAQRLRDADRTRQRILDAARREFGMKGFDGARVGEIARRARVNKGLIFYYFQSKEELFRVLSEERIAATLPIPGESPVDWPLHLFAEQDATVDWVRYFLWEGLSFDPSNPDALPQVAFRSTTFRQVVEEVKRQQQSGSLPSSMDAQHLTLFLYVLGVYPYVLPQMAYLITGHAPSDPNFRGAYARFLRDVATLLASAADAAPT